LTTTASRTTKKKKQTDASKAQILLLSTTTCLSVQLATSETPHAAQQKYLSLAPYELAIYATCTEV